MSRRINVNPDHYKVAGRERQGENNRPRGRTPRGESSASQRPARNQRAKGSPQSPAFRSA